MVSGVKLAFHDADTDTDSPDTCMHPYVRYARFTREEVRIDVGVGVHVGIVEADHWTSAGLEAETETPSTVF